MNNTKKANEQYSQNRIRRKVLRRLLARSSIDQGDLVYDIGAGDGVITLELVSRCARVISIEKDPRLYQKLVRKIGNNVKVTLSNRDIVTESLPGNAQYKVFANIPFDCTAQIVRKLLFGPNPPTDCYLVLQKEAAERFSGMNRECLMSLMLKPAFEFSILHRFVPGDFFPVPGVDIVFLRVQQRKHSLVSSPFARLYQEFVVYVLSCGKPTVKQALQCLLSYRQFIHLSHDLSFGPASRPTDLNFTQWFGVFSFIIENENNRRKLVCLPKRKIQFC